jgi:hypothetical protein
LSDSLAFLRRTSIKILTELSSLNDSSHTINFRRLRKSGALREIRSRYFFSENFLQARGGKLSSVIWRRENAIIIVTRLKD